MKAFWISIVCLCLTDSLLAQSPTYQLVKKTIIGGEGGWDYLLADAEGSRLYVSHGMQVDVLDLTSHEKIGIITPTPGIHGIAVVPGTAQPSTQSKEFGNQSNDGLIKRSLSKNYLT